MNAFEVIFFILMIASYIFMANEFFSLVVKIFIRFKLKNEDVKFVLTNLSKIIMWVSLTIIISWHLLHDKI